MPDYSTPDDAGQGGQRQKPDFFGKVRLLLRMAPATGQKPNTGRQKPDFFGKVRLLLRMAPATS
ncbi:MAG: hypothetical protein V9H69_07420 [Anaerolineae bacterium]|jgi:hypothetical protein